MDSTMNEFLPAVRCSQELKSRLQRIAQASIAPDLAAHIRRAVEQYVEPDDHMLSAQATEQLYQLSPELERALGQRVESLDEITAALMRHWERTKKETYGASLN